MTRQPQLWLITYGARKYDQDERRTQVKMDAEVIEAPNEQIAKDTAFHLAGQYWPPEEGWTQYTRDVKLLPLAFEADGQTYEIRVVPRTQAAREAA